MSLSPALVADLEELTAPLHLSDSALTRSIELLENAAVLLVSSLIGWTLTITLDGVPLTLTSIHAESLKSDQVRASLRVPFTFMSGLDAAEIVVLYAARPDAFTLFAVDVAGALHIPEDELQLDRDLSPTLVPGITGLAEWCTVNQAVGMLVERGDTISSAHETLERDALIVDLDTYRAAKNLLSDF